MTTVSRARSVRSSDVVKSIIALVESLMLIVVAWLNSRGSVNTVVLNVDKS